MNRNTAEDDALTGTLPLTAEFAVADFSCGTPALDEYLIRHALHAQRVNTARTFVALRGKRVVGYYSLAAASVEPDQAPPRILQGAGRYPIPLTLLARLAVDLSEQGAGLGRALLKDAMKRFLISQEQVASRALLVHASDAVAREFTWLMASSRSPSTPFISICYQRIWSGRFVQRRNSRKADPAEPFSLFQPTCARHVIEPRAGQSAWS